MPKSKAIVNVDCGSVNFGYSAIGEMSAATFVYTMSGFLVAADSRRGDTGTIVRKLFPLGPIDTATVAVALVGQFPILFSDDTGQVTLDLAAHIAHVLGSYKEPLMGLQDCMTKISVLLGHAIIAVAREQHVPDFTSHLLFCGYASYVPEVGKVPEVGAIDIKYNSQDFGANPDTHPIAIGGLQGFYSHHVWGALFNPYDSHYNDCRQYRFASDRPYASRTLNDAIDLTASYFAACQDPEIQKLDPEHCQAVGGPVVAATVTSEKGFKWVLPEKVNAAMAKWPRSA